MSVAHEVGRTWNFIQRVALTVVNIERLLMAVANKIQVSPNVVYRVPDPELEKFMAAIVDEEITVNVRPHKHRGVMPDTYLVGIKKAADTSAKRIAKLLSEKGLIVLAILAVIAASEPRLFACFKSNGLSGELSKKQCISRGGRWLPKGDDMPIPGTRA